MGLAYDHEQAGDGFRADPWACYAVVETEAGGGIAISFRRVPFEAREVAAATRESGMLHADAAAARWH